MSQDWLQNVPSDEDLAVMRLPFVSPQLRCPHCMPKFVDEEDIPAPMEILFEYDEYGIGMNKVWVDCPDCQYHFEFDVYGENQINTDGLPGIFIATNNLDDGQESPGNGALG